MNLACRICSRIAVAASVATTRKAHVMALPIKKISQDFGAHCVCVAHRVLTELERVVQRKPV
jgi:hypothetical protein